MESGQKSKREIFTRAPFSRLVCGFLQAEALLPFPKGNHLPFPRFAWSLGRAADIALARQGVVANASRETKCQRLRLLAQDDNVGVIYKGGGGAN